MFAALLISMIGIPAFAADDTGAGETPAAASDYDYTKDERLSGGSNPEEYNVGDFKWGGKAPAFYGIIANKMFTVSQINKANAIAKAKAAAEDEAAAAAEAEAEGTQPAPAPADEGVEFTVTFDDNGGSGGPGTQACKGSTALSSTFPKRKGYTFIGWAADKEAAIPDYFVGGIWKIDSKEDVTLYAIWDDGVPALKDETSANPNVEGVSVEAFYAFKCPKCGKAVGASTLLTVYTQNEGKCAHCGEDLPDPGTVKIYRFITISQDSSHLKSLKNYDLTKAAKDLYGATAGQYGDGKDLPQSDLVYDEKGVLVDFYTSGNHVEFGDSFMTGLYIFLVKFEKIATPLSISFSESTYNDVVWKIRVFFLGILEKILTFFVSG